MLEVKHRRWVRIFVAVALLLLAQVGWWTSVFMKDVTVIEHLKEENSQLRAERSADGARSEIKVDPPSREAFHRRLMFVSESSFFVLLACIGFYFLFRALKVEERSRETQKNFINVLSHESKTPLTALKLRLESIVEKHGSEDRLKQDLLSALEEVRRLVSVFEKALNLNRLERQAYHFEPVYLADLVNDVVHRLDPLFRSRQISVSLELDREAVVRGDVLTLQASIQNLLENAAIYNTKTIPNRQIRIELTTRPPHVVLWIEDNGPGIDTGEQRRIFERFYRGLSSRRVPGTGLGLYIAKTVVEAHQGMVRLVRGDASGSRFEVVLPQAT